MKRGKGLLAVGLIAGLLVAGASFATTAAAAGAPATLTGITPAKIEAGQPVTLAAKLTDDTTRRVVGGVEIKFMVLTDVFGSRWMEVGKAFTDATGVAAISYKPSWVGDTRVSARFAGNTQYAATEVSYAFQAVGPIPQHENARFGLEPIRAWAPAVVAAVVLSVWIILGFVVIRTVMGMRAPRPVSVTAPQSDLGDLGELAEPSDIGTGGG
jgi:hypothetical protein